MARGRSIVARGVCRSQTGDSAALAAAALAAAISTAAVAAAIASAAIATLVTAASFASALMLGFVRRPGRKGRRGGGDEEERSLMPGSCDEAGDQTSSSGDPASCGPHDRSTVLSAPTCALSASASALSEAFCSSRSGSASSFASSASDSDPLLSLLEDDGLPTARGVSGVDEWRREENLGVEDLRKDAVRVRPMYLSACILSATA